MAKVSLTNVHSSSSAGLDGFNLEVADRELLVLAGPVGCGNSAALRVIAGLSEVSAGDIVIDDRRVNDLPPDERDVAMVFATDALYPRMSVAANLASGLTQRKVPTSEIAKRVRDAAQVLGLEAFLERKPTALSEDQRQRVALGRAIVRQPKVLLLDRPLSTLPAQAQVEMRAEIRKLHQRLQTTTIYATHDPVEAMIMGDRIAIMQRGAVEQIGAPLDLYTRPANLFVAGFLGSPPMNLIRGTISETSKSGLVFQEVTGGAIQFSLPPRDGGKALAGKDVVLGIRPEDFKAVDGPTGPADARVQAIVDSLESMGAETIYHLQTGAHILVCRTGGIADRNLAGRRMTVAFDPQAALFFDGDSGKRIEF